MQTEEEMDVIQQKANLSEHIGRKAFLIKHELTQEEENEGDCQQKPHFSTRHTHKLENKQTK